MKKKLTLIAVLCMVLALLFIGCKPTGGGNETGGNEPGGNEPGGNEPGGGDPTFAECFPDTVLNGNSAVITFSGNTMTAVKGTSNSRLDADLLKNGGGFDASAYKGIKFEYKTTQQVNVGLQDSIDSSSMWIITDWGAFTESNWTSVEIDFSKDLMKGWGNSTAFNKAKWEKMWIGCDNPTSETKFEIRGFAFIK
jgi:hypothetical protein